MKKILAAAETKKNCCRHTLSELEALSPDGIRADNLAGIRDRFRCDGCRTVFFRELFLRCGSVTDPMKSYQLDFSFPDEETAAVVRDALAEAGFSFGKSRRRGKTVLWLRESGAIEDFLALIGAASASFEVMNAKIDGEFRANVQRQVNFDTANIEKQLRAVKKYTDAVRKLKAAGKYDLLPEEVRETGELRAANEGLTFPDLGKLHNPPITKSGVKHRLEKILRAAEELENGAGD